MNAREYVKSLLLDDNIISLTGDNTVHFLHADNPVNPYIEYELYNEVGAEWEEGKEIATTFYLQVDIFSTGSYTALEEAIKNKLLNAGFEGGHGPDLYEQATMLYHKPLRFNFTKKLEV